MGADASAALSTSLSQAVSWNYANSREILEGHTLIPAILHRRLSIDWSDKENCLPLPRASGIAGHDAHWLDRPQIGVKAHIKTMQQKRDKLVALARPPQAVLDVASTDPGAVKLGAGSNKAYAAALRMGKGRHSGAGEGGG